MLSRAKILAVATGVQLLLAALGAVPATADAVRLPTEHAAGYLPVASRSAGVRPDDAQFSNVDYNGGPVMPSNTDYTIYWSPHGLSAFPAEYVSGIAKYFYDVERDSGGHGDVDSVAAQYNDAPGDTANYAADVGAQLVDTDPFPAGGCPAKPGRTCLTDAQIESEFIAYRGYAALRGGLTDIYFFILPPGIDVCDGTSFCTADATRSAFACAYHSAWLPGGGGEFVYAVIPYVVGNDGCTEAGAQPNGPSDVAVNLIAHEQIESITDPIGGLGWWDYTTSEQTGEDEEVADKCAWDGGDASYDQVINGDLYWTQYIWSDSGSQCLPALPPNYAPPVAQFTSSAQPGTTITFNASGSSAPDGIAHYHWQFNDNGYPSALTEAESTSPTITHTFPKPGCYDVALTVYEANGTPRGAADDACTGDQGPIPTFTVSAAHSVPGQPVAFDASGSQGSSLTYGWNFGDGVTSVIGSSSPTPTHTYASAGTYEVTLTVLDSQHQTATASRLVYVRGAPDAAFVLVPALPWAGHPAFFDAASSSEINGSISSYRWSFGDGTPAASGETVGHDFAYPGTYLVTLTATDQDGVSATAIKHVTVRVPPKITRLRVHMRELLVTVDAAGTVTVGRRSVRLRRPGTATIRLRLTHRQAAALRRHHRIKLRLRVRYVPVDGFSMTETVRVTVRS